MKTLILTAVTAFLFLPQSASAKVSVDEPYAFATSQMQKNGAVFFSLTNAGDKDRKVVEARSDIAETIELHTHVMDGGVMQMREVPHYLVPAEGQHDLKPMGDHVMLIGLNEQLSEGQIFPLTLVFEDGEEMTIDVSVVKAGQAPHSESMDHNHSHDHEHHGHH